MNIAIVLLDYLRHTFTDQAIEGFNKGNYPFDLFTIDRLGIAAALNEGIDKTREYDAVAFCGNDIQMPENWLAMAVNHIKAIPNTGMCGVHCVESLPSIELVNGLQVHPTWAPFGNVVVPRKAIDAVGYFNEQFDPYGMQDSDYGFRLNALGFYSYYMNGLKSNHLGHDLGEQSDYRRMKDEGLNRSGEIWERCIREYKESNNYTII